MSNEIYEGVKFRTIFLSNEIQNDKRLEELKKWCKTFHDLNLAPPYEGGSSGNLSFRISNNSNEFIITGSQIGLKNNLKNKNFVKVEKCDFDNKIIFAHGTKNPSSESMLHYAIYKKRSDVNAIFHGHSLDILNNAKRLKFISTKQEEKYGTTKLVDSVLDIIGDNNFIILKNHGFMAFGKTIEICGSLSAAMLNLCNKKGLS